jgi:lysophospholipase L1-like esterase
MRNPARLLPSLGVLVLAASSAIGAGLPAAAAPMEPIRKYVALGDSFAAGQGAGGYQEGRNGCLQSTNGYPAALDAVKGINLLRNASCSGATTKDVRDTQLSAVNKGTTLVTLTVVGNDLGVGDVAVTCTTEPPRCGAAVLAAGDKLRLLAGDLVSTYTGIAAAAPNAQILVTGYPHLFETSLIDPGGQLSLINLATDRLNGTIQAAVSTAKETGANIEFVDVTGVFMGHGIAGLPDAGLWVNSAGPDVFHPNAAGYLAYASVLRAAQ